MKRQFLIIILLLMSLAASAQHNENKEKIKAAKIGVITEHLNLSADQAQKFWPLYNEYDTEMMSVKRKLNKLKRSLGAVSDSELSGSFSRIFELEEKEIALRKKYHKKFEAVLTLRQIAALYKAETHFKRVLLKQLRKREGPPPGGSDDF